MNLGKIREDKPNRIKQETPKTLHIKIQFHHGIHKTVTLLHKMISLNPQYVPANELNAKISNGKKAFPHSPPD